MRRRAEIRPPPLFAAMAADGLGITTDASAFYQDDIRHHKCNVCSAEFNIPPPTRHELMASFTGAEIAALISEGCVIGSHPDFDAQLSSQMRRMDPLQRLVCGYRHWIGGAYLITGVVPDDGVETLPVRTDATLDAIRSRLGRGGENPLVLVVGGRARTVVAEGSLEGVAPERMEDALRQLRAPATLVLSSGTTPDCGEDHVSAVNLTRPLRLDDAEDEDAAGFALPSRDDDDGRRRESSSDGLGGGGAARGARRDGGGMREISRRARRRGVTFSRRAVRVGRARVVRGSRRCASRVDGGDDEGRGGSSRGDRARARSRGA